MTFTFIAIKCPTHPPPLIPRGEFGRKGGGPGGDNVVYIRGIRYRSRPHSQLLLTTLLPQTSNPCFCFRESRYFSMLILFVWLGALVGCAAGQCSPSPCGVNTQCDVNPAGAAVCRFVNKYGQSNQDFGNMYLHTMLFTLLYRTADIHLYAI